MCSMPLLTSSFRLGMCSSFFIVSSSSSILSSAVASLQWCALDCFHPCWQWALTMAMATAAICTSHNLPTNQAICITQAWFCPHNNYNNNNSNNNLMYNKLHNVPIVSCSFNYQPKNTFYCLIVLVAGFAPTFPTTGTRPTMNILLHSGR